MSRKPKVGTAYPADRYASPEERIIEVSHKLGGCLISVRPVNGRLVIEIYQADDTVEVRSATRCKCCTDNECECEGRNLK